MAQIEENMRKIAAALADATPAAPARQDESTDYGKLLAIFSALDPQQVEKTLETFQLGLKPRIVMRLKLGGRFMFIFDGNGSLNLLVDLKGERVSLVADPSRLSGKCDYQTILDVIAPYILSPVSRTDVKVEPEADGGPRITINARATFTFTPDGCLRGFFEETSDKRFDANKPPMPASPATPPSQANQPQMERMPMPAQPTQQSLRVAIPGRSAGQADSAAAAPWPQPKGQGT